MIAQNSVCLTQIDSVKASVRIGEPRSTRSTTYLWLYCFATKYLYEEVFSYYVHAARARGSATKLEYDC